MFLPLVFRTDNINTLVIGGGKVAYRKVKDLNAAGAELMVISPRCHPGLETFIIEKDIDWCKRKFRNGDTDGYSLVIVATDDDKVNQKVSTEAKNSGIPINVVDKPELSTVYFPATVRKDSLLISVSTEGNAPFFAREMKKKISEWVEDGEWELKAKWAAKLRAFSVAHIDKTDQREKLFGKFMELTADELAEWNFANPPEDLWKKWFDNLIV